ncbi:MAG: siphovirus Gp157 family protein [Xanthobacteraceae bacterium]
MATALHKSRSVPAAAYLAMDVDVLTRHLELLLADYPELADDPDLRADMVEGSTTAFDVLDRIVAAERDAKSMVFGLKSRIADIASRKSRYERKQEAMRALAFKVMKAAGLPSVSLTEATISIGRKAAALEIFDEVKLPRWAIRVTKSPDRDAIKAALQEGKKVNGARMGEPGEQLTVRAA